MTGYPKLPPLIIGQAPARGNDGKPPFSGDSGTRLAQLAGVGDSGDVLPQYFTLYNLFDTHPGPAEKGKGDAFDQRKAKVKAQGILQLLGKPGRPHRFVLLMGKQVARAFGSRHREYLEPWQWKQHTFVVFPHPSGLNHWYNNPENVEAAAKYLRGVLDATRK